MMKSNKRVFFLGGKNTRSRLPLGGGETHKAKAPSGRELSAKLTEGERVTIRGLRKRAFKYAFYDAH